MKKIDKVIEILKEPRKVAIFSHRNPDGDAIGSSLALQHFLEKMGHFLDEEVQRLFKWYKDDYDDNMKVTEKITENIDLHRVIMRSARKFDGGYVMAGMFGHGDAFVLRDPNGIRPAFYYQDKEIVVVASERPAIQTAFNIHYSKIKEVKPGHALIIKADGQLTEESILATKEPKSCSFERVYFSRGTDRDM